MLAAYASVGATSLNPASATSVMGIFKSIVTAAINSALVVTSPSSSGISGQIVFKTSLALA